jgi:hypothetical protein
VGLLIPNEGETQLLTDLLGGGALENWTLKLFTSATTPAETDTAATYTEATFTGYSAKTLTRSIGASTWNTPASGAPTNAWSAEAAVAESVYGSAAQSWSATSAQTIQGYILVGATSTKLIGAEKFASPISLVNPSSLTLQPRFGAS